MLNLGPLHLGWLELVIILVVILLIFGPKNLPKLGNAIGRTVKNLRKGMDGEDDIEPKVTHAEATEGTAADIPTPVAADDESEKPAQ